MLAAIRRLVTPAPLKEEEEQASVEAPPTGESSVPEVPAPLEALPEELPADSVKHIKLPWEKRAYHCFVVENVLSPTEVQQLRDWAFSEGRWEAAMVNVGAGRQQLDTSYRNHRRAMLDDPRLTDLIFARLRPFFPEVINRRRCAGLNERLRFLRYGPGNFFAPHGDGTFARMVGNDYQQSELTAILYLSNLEECRGTGCTRFVSPMCNLAGSGRCDGPSCSKCLDARTPAGSVLVFTHRLCHAGTEVAVGEKVVMRTDVMYQQEGK